MMGARGKVESGDVIMMAIVITASLALAPFMFDMIEALNAVVGPLTVVILALLVPVLLIGTIVSMGVSARRGT